MGYQSVTRISKQFGRTVNQMKIILVEGRLLTDTGPTDQAITSGAARLVPLDPDNATYATNGRTHYPQWDFDTIKRLMEARGEKPGDRKVVSTAYDAMNALEDIGRLMDGMPGMDRKLADMLLNSGHSGNLGLRILTGDNDGLLTYMREILDPVRETAKRKRGRWKDPARKIIAWLDAIELFLKKRGCQ